MDPRNFRGFIIFEDIDLYGLIFTKKQFKECIIMKK